MDEIGCLPDMKAEMRSVTRSKAKRKTFNDGLSLLKSLQEATTEIFEGVGSDVQDQSSSFHSTVAISGDPGLSLALENLRVHVLVTRRWRGEDCS